MARLVIQGLSTNLELSQVDRWWTWTAAADQLLEPATWQNLSEVRNILGIIGAMYIYIYVKIHGRYTTYRVCSRVFFVVQVLYRYWLHGSRNQKTGVKGWKFEDVVPPTVEIEDESESKRNGLQTSTNPCLLVQGPIWPNLAGWSWIPILGVSLKWWYPPFHTAKNEDF